MTEMSGRLATAIVQRYRDRFGRGPTEAKAVVSDEFALLILGNARLPHRAATLGLDNLCFHFIHTSAPNA